jgi:hypothetical protein
MNYFSKKQILILQNLGFDFKNLLNLAIR